MVYSTHIHTDTYIYIYKTRTVEAPEIEAGGGVAVLGAVFGVHLPGLVVVALCDFGCVYVCVWVGCMCGRGCGSTS
jgi:hypothetical protein